MKYKILIIFLSFCILSYAQTEKQKNEILKHTDVEQLQKLQQYFNELDAQKKLKVKKFSQLNNWKIRKYEDGKLVAVAIDVNEKGMPIYQISHNQDAAISTRTNYLYPNGGLSNVAVEGENMLIGIWEAEDQIPLTSHIEFTKSPFDNQTRVDIKDQASSPGNHATHVAGTMIARGSNLLAKGMAPKANMVAYNSFGDQSEVASEISNNSLLISNHSYGVRLFDNGNLVQNNAYPGKYDQAARSWDQIHYSSPYYLMVVSAGNDGVPSYNGSLTVGGDKLTGEKNSKNNLVVANARDAQIDNQGNLSSVSINTSSSQGPTDDRRIKPDIAGNGTDLISSLSQGNQSYGSRTGTSMAAPNVSGTLLLLQQLYSEKNDDEFMKSATLKGLVCHTADDAGKLGPDPSFGWGLLNAKRAAEVILGNDEELDEDKTNIIKELTLNQGSTYTIPVVASGNEPLKASITWTDFPGSANNAGINDATSALVNNLDIRITDSNGQEFLPWQLNFFDPKDNAIKGDNNFDNIERVDIENASGNYTITITHKGTLQTGSQDYSLVITGISGGTVSVNELENNNVAIWPNPANNSINFTSPNGFTDASIEIYDLNGRVVKTFRDINASKTFSGDLTGMAAGVYIAKVNDVNNGTIQKRIIKK